MDLFLWNIQNGEVHRTESRLVVVRSWGESRKDVTLRKPLAQEVGVAGLKDMGVSLGDDKCFGAYRGNGCKHCKCTKCFHMVNFVTWILAQSREKGWKVNLPKNHHSKWKKWAEVERLPPPTIRLGLFVLLVKAVPCSDEVLGTTAHMGSRGQLHCGFSTKGHSFLFAQEDDSVALEKGTSRPYQASWPHASNADNELTLGLSGLIGQVSRFCDLNLRVFPFTLPGKTFFSPS